MAALCQPERRTRWNVQFARPVLLAVHVHEERSAFRTLIPIVWQRGANGSSGCSERRKRGLEPLQFATGAAEPSQHGFRAPIGIGLRTTGAELLPGQLRQLEPATVADEPADVLATGCAERAPELQCTTKLQSTTKLQRTPELQRTPQP